MADEIQKSINKAIDTIIKNRINALALDKTVIAIIDALIDPVMNIYRVQYDGGYFNAVNKQTNSVYRRGMSVYVQIPQNDMTKEKIIIGRAYATKGSELANSVISAVNSYSIMGGNLLKTTENKLPDSFALRSYHDKRYENIIDSEGNVHHPTSHRAQYFLGDTITHKDYYDLDDASLDIYKESATGLMLQADFRTALSTEQKNQVSGSYGLVLNLVFENSSYQYGETEEEIFNCFAKDIKVENVLVLNPEEDAESEFIAVSKSVADYANDFRNDINFSGTEEEKKNKVQNLLKTDGLIDMYISYIESITNVYSQANPQLFLPEADAAINSFIQMLKDIKAIFTEESSLADIYEEYKNWADLAIAPPAEKNISYVLDSNHMTGAPFYFSSWSTQYEIFNIDFSTFKRIDSILFYKDGFISDNAKDERIGDDIFVKDLKIYALQPISAINGDYSLKLNAPDGYIFSEEVLEEESPIKLKAQVFKQYITDLSDQVAFQWFKANPAITSVGHDDYRPYGGLGWKYLERKGNKKNFEVTRSENVAYENKYKCVAIVDSSVVLSQEFMIYNEAVSDNIVITSDQGTLFSFDSGTPLLTACFYDRKQSEETGEKVYEERVPTAEAFTNYTYQWAIVVNGQRTFLDKFKKDINVSLSIQDNMTAQNLATLINGVKFYRGETLIEKTDDIKYATRMLYPVRNIAFESNAIFECYIQDNNEEKGSASLAIQNQAQGAAVDYKITIEGGEQIFQYDEYGGPPNDKKLKTPQEIKPLICHFFNPTGLEVGSGSYHVEWIVPIENTLITTNTVLQSNPLNNYVFEIDSNQQCSFGIAELYDENCQNNQIICRVIYNDKTFTQSTNMFFGKVGSNGTNGTDMVLKIEPTSTIPLLDNQPLTLYRSEWDEELSKYTVLTLNDGTIVRNGDLPLSATDDVVNHLRARLFQKNDEIAVTRGTIKWNVAGSTQTTANNVGKYLKTEDGALIWSEDFQKNKQDNFIIRAWIRYLNKDYYGFYNLPVIEYTGVLPRVSRISIDKKFLLKDIVYNADGRNPIYSHTQGVKINNIPAGGYVVWEAVGGVGDNQEDCFFSLLENKDSNQGVKEITPIWKRNDTDEVIEEFTNEITQEDCYIAEYPPEQVYILPYDEYDGGYCNNRVIAKIYRSNNTLLAKVIIPIHMSLNTFGLASLNAWDGTSVTVDEEGGYIMAPQIGAGEKDDNNRFTGVVMGKTETYTGGAEKEKQIGVLGYSHGLQSIFLDSETGNAYFGIPGGYRLDKTKNPPVPIVDDDNYNEGRIELIPGGVSKISGWRLGRKALYYTVPSGNLGPKYGTSDLPDYIPDKHGRISKGNAYSNHHEKDISNDDAGILIFSGEKPYISVKGRKLYPEKEGHPDHELLSQNADSYLLDGDSLELQLDPSTPTLFTIFRHNGKARKKSDDSVLYQKDSRTFLAGINAKGQLMANGLQDVTPTSGGETVTNFGISTVPAFGEVADTATHIGLKMAFGSNNVAKIFVKNDLKADTTLYYSGATTSDNEYARPLSFHGASISLYASSTKSIAKTTSSKLVLDNSKLEMGNSSSYLNLYTGDTAKNELKVSGNLNISTGKTITAESTSGIINIFSRGGSGNREILLQTENSSGNPLSKIQLTNKTGDNNGIEISTQGKASLTAKGDIELIRDTNSYLKIQGNTIDLRTADNNNRLYLKDDVNTNSSLTTKGNLNIVSNNNTITIKTKGAAVNSPAIYLSANTTTSGFENYLKMWANVRSFTQSLTLFELRPAGFNPIRYQSGAKPGITNTATNSWASNDTYGYQTSALVIGEYGETGYYGGLASAWGYFSGKMYDADKYTSNENLVNASLYSRYGIHGGTWIKANDSIITGDDFKFSSSWNGTGSEQTEDGDGHVGTAEKTYNASGSTFKGLIQQANNRAAAAYVHLPEHNHSFSKGITVKVSEGDSNGVSVTQGSAGSNATINVTVKPILTGTSTHIGGEFQSASVTFSHENYQRAGITGYTKGAESTKDPGYYQVQEISRDIYYKADNGSTTITINPQSTSHRGDLNIIKITNTSHKVSEVTVQDNHAATITNFSNNKHSISGISNSAGSN